MLDLKKTIRQIISVIVSLILLSVGIFAFYVTIEKVDTVVDTSYDRTFTVTDALLDQTLDTNVEKLKSIVVTQFDGTSWTTVPAANVSYSGTTITVEHEGLVWIIK